MATGAPPFYDNLNGITGEIVQQIIRLMPGLDETHRKILSFMALSGHGWRQSQYRRDRGVHRFQTRRDPESSQSPGLRRGGTAPWSL